MNFDSMNCPTAQTIPWAHGHLHVPNCPPHHFLSGGRWALGAEVFLVSKKRRSAQEKKHTPDYLEDILKRTAHAQLPPGLIVVEIKHDAWCDLINGRGPCNCSPDVQMPPLQGKN